MADVAVPGMETLSPVAGDTVLGVQGGALKRFPVGTGSGLVREADLANAADPEKGGALVGLPGLDGNPSSVAEAIAGIVAGVVTPFMFRVSNDGATDYTEQLRSMHTYANASGCRVDYHGLKSCKIQAAAYIVVNTDVDFAGCDFKILNGIVGTPSHDTVNTLFTVIDQSRPSFSVSLTPAELYQGAPWLSVPSTVRSGYLHVVSNKELPRRTSSPDVPLYFEQGFMVSKGGLLNMPLGADLAANTVSATFYPASDKWLTIKGIAADETTFNNQCLLRVRRSHVIVDTPYVDLLTNAAPLSINYLLVFNYCGSVVLRNLAIRPNTIVGSSGTYTINLDRVADVAFEGCRSIGGTSWGTTGCNHVNGWRVIDCDLNRIDVHAGMHNLTVRGGTLHGDPIQYGWGTGFIDVSGVSILRDQPVVRSRNDYSGDFDGDISIREIRINYGTITPSGDGLRWANPIVHFDGLGSAGFSTKSCRTLKIDGVQVIANAADGELFVRPVFLTKATGSPAVISPNRVEVGGIKSASFRPSISLQLRLHQLLSPSSGKLVIRLHDMECYPQPLYTVFENPDSVAAYVDPSMAVMVFAENMQGYSQYAATPNAVIRVVNSKVYGVKSYSGGNSNQEIYYSNVEFDNTISIGGGGVGDSGIGAAKIVIDGAVVNSPANLSAAKALSGVLVKTGVSCSLPAGATFVTANSGWFDSGVFRSS